MNDTYLVLFVKKFNYFKVNRWFDELVDSPNNFILIIKTALLIEHLKIRLQVPFLVADNQTLKTHHHHQENLQWLK